MARQFFYPQGGGWGQAPVYDQAGSGQGAAALLAFDRALRAILGYAQGAEERKTAEARYQTDLGFRQRAEERTVEQGRQQEQAARFERSMRLLGIAAERPELAPALESSAPGLPATTQPALPSREMQLPSFGGQDLQTGGAPRTGATPQGLGPSPIRQAAQSTMEQRRAQERSGAFAGAGGLGFKIETEMDLAGAETALRSYVEQGSMTQKEADGIAAEFRNAFALRRDAEGREAEAKRKLQLRLAGARNWTPQRFDERAAQQAVLDNDLPRYNAIRQKQGLPGATAPQFAELNRQAATERDLGLARQQATQDELNLQRLVSVQADPDALAIEADRQGITLEEAQAKLTSAATGDGRGAQATVPQRAALEEHRQAYQEARALRAKGREVKPEALKAAEDRLQAARRRLGLEDIRAVSADAAIDNAERKAIREGESKTLGLMRAYQESLQSGSAAKFESKAKADFGSVEAGQAALRDKAAAMGFRTVREAAAAQAAAGTAPPSGEAEPSPASAALEAKGQSIATRRAAAREKMRKGEPLSDEDIKALADEDIKGLLPTVPYADRLKIRKLRSRWQMF